jgi:hypothetical protein
MCVVGDSLVDITCNEGRSPPRMVGCLDLEAGAMNRVPNQVRGRAGNSIAERRFPHIRCVPSRGRKGVTDLRDTHARQQTCPANRRRIGMAADRRTAKPPRSQSCRPVVRIRPRFGISARASSNPETSRMGTDGTNGVSRRESIGSGCSIALALAPQARSP